MFLIKWSLQQIIINTVYLGRKYEIVKWDLICVLLKCFDYILFGFFSIST